MSEIGANKSVTLIKINELAKYDAVTNFGKF